MKLSRTRLIVYTIILTIGVLWLTNTTQQLKTHTDSNIAKEPQFSWKTLNTTIWELKTDTANQQSIITTQEFRYQNSTNSSQFNQPKVYLINDNSITSITSEHGKSQDDTIFEFNKNVNITQQNLINKEKVNLKTEYLTYNITSETVSTDDKIQINFPQGKITGSGFHGNLATRDFTVKSNVKTELNPQQQ